MLVFCVALCGKVYITMLVKIDSWLQFQLSSRQNVLIRELN